MTTIKLLAISAVILSTVFAATILLTEAKPVDQVFAELVKGPIYLLNIFMFYLKNLFNVMVANRLNFR